jgi:hypothetical protein
VYKTQNGKISFTEKIIHNFENNLQSRETEKEEKCIKQNKSKMD